MAERKAIGKKLRFEVFKRDSFTCQYCGKMAPDIVLEIDHINPVANGGDNDIMNLVTACKDCNRGKGKIKLSEHTEIKKQQEQLKLLNEKREQLKMMLEWKDELSKFEDEQFDDFRCKFETFTCEKLSDYGEGLARKWIKQFGLIEVLDCMLISYDQYYDPDKEKSFYKFFDYIPRIATTRKRQSDNPIYAKHNYIKGILRNRISYVNEKYLMNMLRENTNTETGCEDIILIAKECRNWTDFRNQFNEYYGSEY